MANLSALNLTGRVALVTGGNGGIRRLTLASMVLAGLMAGSAAAQPKKPNIVVIWGDDVGLTNLSVYSRGVMGYRTPNIDRIASEGAVFTDHYAHPSCTAGRAAFITGITTVRLRIEQSQLVSAVETEREIGGIGKGLLQRHFLEQRDRKDL